MNDSQVLNDLFFQHISQQVLQPMGGKLLGLTPEGNCG